MSFTSTLRAGNRRIAAKIDRRWPYQGPRAFDEFADIVGRCVDGHCSEVLVDIGAGSDSSFIDLVGRDRERLTVIGIDVAPEALAANQALDERHVADVVEDGLPLRSASVGVIASRSLLEHLSSVEALVSESVRVLRPGGYSVHIFSCRNSPFAVAGRVLPHRVSQRLLFALHPEAATTQGFETHYDHCTPNQITKLFARHGLEVVERRISYRSSQYFTSLGPLFLLARAYESLLAHLDLQRLGSYVTIVAQKPADPSPSLPRVRSQRPRVVYWNYMPAPYMVDRFNALAARQNVDFEAWFSARREPHWSGAWTVEESSWLFDHTYIPHVFVGGRSVGFPPGLIGPRPPTVLMSPHGEPSFVAGWALARARGIRTAFWVVKTFDTWTPRRAYKEALKRYMFPRTDAIFVPGDDAREYACRYGAPDERIFTLQHPVDRGFVQARASVQPSDRERIRRDLGLAGTTFIYVGRLWWGKGLKHLLAAFAEVQRSGVSASLLLIGDGEERSDLEKSASDTGLRNVVFTGFQQTKDLARYYAAADVFVFPTLGDPFGLVVGEAMSSGLPVISTSAAGEIRSRVEDGSNGFIVPPGQRRMLAERMMRLATDPVLGERMGRISAEKVKDRTADRWAADFEIGIEHLLGLPSTASRG